MAGHAVIDSAGSGRSFVDNPKINQGVPEQQGLSSPARRAETKFAVVNRAR
jgi:hypothetical protein